MFNVFLAASTATGFISYPGFADPKSRVETVTDLGPVLEIVIKCNKGSAIMAYSKVERTFCSAKWTCYRDIERAMAASCR